MFRKRAECNMQSTTGDQHEKNDGMILPAVIAAIAGASAVAAVIFQKARTNYFKEAKDVRIEICKSE